MFQKTFTKYLFIHIKLDGILKNFNKLVVTMTIIYTIIKK